MGDSSKNSKPDRLDDLLHEYCDNTLDEASHRELEQLLSNSDSAAIRYIELVQLWTEVMDWAEIAESPDDRDCGRATVAADSPHSLTRYWLGLSCVAALLAVAFCVGVYWGEGSRTEQAQPLRWQDATKGKLAPSVAQPEQNQYVARVVEVTEDATWGEFKPEEFLLRLSKGEQLDLRTGIARIEFSSGASVILDGPARFEPLAGDAARLLSGRMTGRADKGNFKLFTSVAEVIDLGTEFGVSVDLSSGTDVCVFDGEVDVAVVGGAARSEDVGAVRLTEGMALRVTPSGTINEAASVNRGEFHRHVSQIARQGGTPHHISLVDIIAGGDRRSKRLASAIDPRTGRWDSQVLLDAERRRDRFGDGRYMFSEASPLIDGVFIPSAEGFNVTLDSSGSLFDFGKNEGATWGPIWSRRHIPQLRLTVGSVSDFWGTDTLDGVINVVEKSKYGVVGMHANVGLTIDMRAVRMLEGKPLTNFHAEIANLDNSRWREPEYAKDHRPSVDFWVFIDGKLQYERRDFGRDDGAVAVDVPIGSDDRFLTLVSTDAGNLKWYDHLVLIDPVLHLEGPQPAF